MSGPDAARLAAEAAALAARGDFAAATEAARRSLALDPQGVEASIVLGDCLLALDRFGEAHDVFLLLLRRDQSIAAAHFGFGAALERMGDLAGAEREMGFAVAIDPSLAAAHVALAGYAQQAGDLEAARAHLNRALAFEPDAVAAQLLLARIDVTQGRFETAERRLEAVLQRAETADDLRSRGLITLGDALDGQGRYHEAFEAYSAGKAILERLNAPAFAGVERAPDQAVRIALQFKQARDAFVTDDAVASHPPVHAFVLGFARSGTTLLERVLAAHPDVSSVDERPLMFEAERDFLIRPEDFQALAQSPATGLEPYRAAYWQAAERFGADLSRKVFVEKRPMGAYRIPLAMKLFPRAKIIFATRDPRDVVLSCFRRDFEINQSTREFCSLSDTARYYSALMSALSVYRVETGIEVHQIKLEALVADFDCETRALCKFLEIEWRPDLRDFARRDPGRAIRSPSATQVRGGLYAEASAPWRDYAWALAPLAPILDPWIEAFGYDPS